MAKHTKFEHESDAWDINPDPKRRTVVEGAGSTGIQDQGRVLAGFLVSFSKKSQGEHWPLYLGQNTIGRDRTNDVVLQDERTSGQHAMVTLRYPEDGSEMYMVIKDNLSSNGTMVNKKDIRNDVCLLENHSLIDIGHYSLLFLIVDARHHALQINTQLKSGPSVELPKTPQKELRSPYDYTARSPKKNI